MTFSRSRITAIAFAAASLGLIAPLDALAQQGDKKGHNMEPPPEEWEIPPAPVVTPEDALETFAVEDGFGIEIVAAEPDVHDPVAIAFDGNGRMWVAEMRGYMPDVDGHGEDVPNGRITILEDRDGDGKVDRTKVFLDEIVLPRAIAHVEGGILYGDQAKLYFAENKGDNAGKVEVIDDNWAPTGNVEHKTNGLMYGRDNWFYNAKSDARYRKVDGKWVKEETEFRGQWGITQDDYGRIYTNTNSSLISAEQLTPGIVSGNPYHDFTSQTNAKMDNRVWPARITCGVNRGYQEGTLDDKGYLTKVTATCGPVLYRGDNFPPEYYGNLFIPEPAGLLVKRAVIKEDGGEFDIQPAYEGREFFTSTDERSRIINAYTAPDGTLYLVDFYRGIIQHKTYVTTYLREQILDRGLDKPVGLGRIYQVVHRGKKPGPQPRMLEETPEQWVAHLEHPNGWWRDMAQQLIVQRGDKSAAPALRKLVRESEKPAAKIAALWSLHGLGEVTVEDLAAAGKWKLEGRVTVDDTIFYAAGLTGTTVADTAVRIAGELGAAGRGEEVLPGLKYTADIFFGEPDGYQLCYALARFRGEGQAEAFDLLARNAFHLSEDHDSHRLLRDVIVSGVAGQETELLERLGFAGHPLSALLVQAVVKSGDPDAIGKVQSLAEEKNNSTLFRYLADASIRHRNISLASSLLEALVNPDTAPETRTQIVEGMLGGKTGKNYKPIAFTASRKPAFLAKGAKPAEGIPASKVEAFGALFDFSGKAPVVYLKTEADKAQYKLGETHYQRICLGCHQPHGKGLDKVAPPLVDSEWVTGSADRLIAITMDGLTGPVEVNGKVYDAPDVQPVMPGLRINPEVNDEQVAAMLTYVRNSWGNGAPPVKTEDVKKYRESVEIRAPYTAEEALEIE